jgi:ADP-heptose:LPS heptosyltransferase
MRFKELTVILPRAMGATLLGTVVLRRLRHKYPEFLIQCISKFPELLEGLNYVDKVCDWDEVTNFEGAIMDREVIDLNGTLDFQPNRRPTPIHLIELLCKRAKVDNDFLGPECHLSAKEIISAQREIGLDRLRSGLPAILITTRTSTVNKEWNCDSWKELVTHFRNRVRWLHVGDFQKPLIKGVEYLSLTPRQSIAVAALVDGVVTLDTFLLHAAASQRRQRGGVIVLLGSSHPYCVSYDTFHNVYFQHLECQPCGRPFSQFDLKRLSDGQPDHWLNGKAKKWECEHVDCMKAVKVEYVADAIESEILDKI